LGDIPPQIAPPGSLPGLPAGILISGDAGGKNQPPQKRSGEENEVAPSTSLQ